MENTPSKPESTIQFPELAIEINAMAKTDQDMREKNLTEPDSWDESVDERNTARMKEIVAHLGWPTVSRVGKEAAHNAWLLVQHTRNQTGFQEQCLKLMEQEPLEEVDRRDIAMLADRIRINRHQPQIYGTQFREIHGQHTPLEIEDQEHVNERRSQMGMESLNENIAGMYKKYGPPEQG